MGHFYLALIRCRCFPSERFASMLKKGWKIFREINRVVYAPDNISVQQMAGYPKKQGPMWKL